MSRPAIYRLGPWLKVERERRGVSREALAVAFGVSDREMELAETGENLALYPGLHPYDAAARLLLGDGSCDYDRVHELRVQMYGIYDEDREQWQSTPGTTKAPANDR